MDIGMLVPRGSWVDPMGVFRAYLGPPGVSMVPGLPMGFSSGKMGLEQLFSGLKVRLLGLGFGVVPAGVFGLPPPPTGMAWPISR